MPIRDARKGTYTIKHVGRKKAEKFIDELQEVGMIAIESESDPDNG